MDHKTAGRPGWNWESAMAAAEKTRKPPAAAGMRIPGGEAFALPDLPDMMSGWVTLTTANARAWQAEWTNFVTRRMEHDRLTMQRFATCRDLMEAAKVQQDWMAEAATAYLEEGRRMAAIATEPALTRSRPSA
jgi:hypothetical protein